MQVRDAVGALFTTDQFADLFPSKDQLAVSPGLLAGVVVLQYLEGLTER